MSQKIKLLLDSNYMLRKADRLYRHLSSFRPTAHSFLTQPRRNMAQIPNDVRDSGVITPIEGPVQSSKSAGQDRFTL